MGMKPPLLLGAPTCGPDRNGALACAAPVSTRKAQKAMRVDMGNIPLIVRGASALPYQRKPDGVDDRNLLLPSGHERGQHEGALQDKDLWQKKCQLATSKGGGRGFLNEAYVG